MKIIHPKKETRSTRQGFTLIELLVVIAIIAILAAILFPVFARARENARRSSCQSNLKQVGLGILQYVQDYDEKYPSGEMGYTTTGTPIGQQTWDTVIQPYVKSGQLIVCPSDSAGTPSPTVHPIYGANAKRSYSAIHQVFGNLAANQAPLSLAAVPASSMTIMLAERDQFFPTSSWTAYAYFNAIAPSQLPFRHLETGTFLYADGHVKSIKGPVPRFPGYDILADGSVDVRYGAKLPE